MRKQFRAFESTHYLPWIALGKQVTLINLILFSYESGQCRYRIYDLLYSAVFKVFVRLPGQLTSALNECSINPNDGDGDAPVHDYGEHQYVFVCVYLQIFGQANTSLKRWVLGFAFRQKEAEMKNGIVRRNSIWDRLIFRKVQVQWTLTVLLYN